MYQCPNCGGRLIFDISSQSMLCEHCNTHYNPYKLGEGNSAEENKEYDVTVFKCPQCGGEIMSTDNTIADFCSFCGASTVLESRISKELRPGYIIPFSKTKQDCKNQYKKMMKRAWFAPKELKDEKYIDGFRGIYMPYWAYHVSQKGPVVLRGEKSKRRGDYIYTDHFNIIARGFYADRFRYLIAVLMLAGVLIILGNHEFGMMDTIFFIQGGYDPVLIIKEGKIVFPFVWMLIQFLVPFMIYSYCNDDCEGVGIDFLMKCRSRRLWWNSKCLWNCLTVLSVYAIQYATAFVYGLCNGNLSMKINYELFEKISNKSVPDNAANVWIIVYMLVMPVVVSLVTALVQMTISMFTNPMIGMLAVMAWNVMSVFINNPLMIGNNSMVVRSSVYNAQRIQVWQSVAVCIVVYIVVYVVGMIGFNKKDILVRED